MSRNFFVLTVICLALIHHVPAVELEINEISQPNIADPKPGEGEQQDSRSQRAFQIASDGSYQGFREAIDVLTENRRPQDGLTMSELELWLVLHLSLIHI